MAANSEPKHAVVMSLNSQFLVHGVDLHYVLERVGDRYEIRNLLSGKTYRVYDGFNQAQFVRVGVSVEGDEIRLFQRGIDMSMVDVVADHAQLEPHKKTLEEWLNNVNPYLMLTLYEECKVLRHNEVDQVIEVMRPSTKHRDVVMLPYGTLHGLNPPYSTVRISKRLLGPACKRETTVKPTPKKLSDLDEDIPSMAGGVYHASVRELKEGREFVVTIKHSSGSATSLYLNRGMFTPVIAIMEPDEKSSTVHVHMIQVASLNKKQICLASEGNALALWRKLSVWLCCVNNFIRDNYCERFEVLKIDAETGVARVRHAADGYEFDTEMGDRTNAFNVGSPVWIFSICTASLKDEEISASSSTLHPTEHETVNFGIKMRWNDEEKYLMAGGVKVVHCQGDVFYLEIAPTMGGMMSVGITCQRRTGASVFAVLPPTKEAHLDVQSIGQWLLGLSIMAIENFVEIKALHEIGSKLVIKASDGHPEINCVLEYHDRYRSGRGNYNIVNLLTNNVYGVRIGLNESQFSPVEASMGNSTIWLQQKGMCAGGGHIATDVDPSQCKWYHEKIEEWLKDVNVVLEGCAYERCRIDKYNEADETFRATRLSNLHTVLLRKSDLVGLEAPYIEVRISKRVLLDAENDWRRHIRQQPRGYASRRSYY